MEDERVGLMFSALADPTRRRSSHDLRDGPKTVGELAARFEVGVPAVSKHLSVLERAGLISRERVAQWRRCRLEAEAFERLNEWIATTSTCGRAASTGSTATWAPSWPARTRRMPERAMSAATVTRQPRRTDDHASLRRARAARLPRPLRAGRISSSGGVRRTSRSTSAPSTSAPAASGTTACAGADGVEESGRARSTARSSRPSAVTYLRDAHPIRPGAVTDARPRRVRHASSSLTQRRRRHRVHRAHPVIRSALDRDRAIQSGIEHGFSPRPRPARRPPGRLGSRPTARLDLSGPNAPCTHTKDRHDDSSADGTPIGYEVHGAGPTPSSWSTGRCASATPARCGGSPRRLARPTCAVVLYDRRGRGAVGRHRAVRRRARDRGPRRARRRRRRPRRAASASRRAAMLAAARRGRARRPSPGSRTVRTAVHAGGRPRPGRRPTRRSSPRRSARGDRRRRRRGCSSAGSACRRKRWRGCGTRPAGPAWTALAPTLAYDDAAMGDSTAFRMRYVRQAAHTHARLTGGASPGLPAVTGRSALADAIRHAQFEVVEGQTRRCGSPSRSNPICGDSSRLPAPLPPTGAG